MAFSGRKSVRAQLEANARGLKAHWYRIFDEVVEGEATDAEKVVYTRYMNLIDQYLEENNATKLKKLHQLMKIEIDVLLQNRGKYDYCSR